jgi:hypothetical protein
VSSDGDIGLLIPADLIANPLHSRASQLGDEVTESRKHLSCSFMIVHDLSYLSSQGIKTAEVQDEVRVTE